jgi:hypothetical protein
LPVRNQLMAKVSIVPRVRQLTALSTDLVCVSAPWNKTTDLPPWLTSTEPITQAQPARRM